MKVFVLTCEDCEHTTPANTMAMATYALASHSCDTTRERAARTQRRLDKLAESGPEQPCQHNDRHPHGDRVRYVIDKCRCRPCRDSAAAYSRDLKRRHLYGKPTYVPADPARDHVRALQAQGMGWKRIARQAGIDCSVMWKLLYGDPSRPQAPSKRIRPTTETAILGVTLNLGDAASVPGDGTRRRLRALVAVGWSQSKLAGRLGMTPANFGKVIHGATANSELPVARVHVATARAVATLYDELWDQPPPHAEWRAHIAYSRALGYAAKAGWVPPLAWDDIDTDIAPPIDEQVKANGRPMKFSIEDVDFILDNDPLTIDQLARRLHVSRNTIEIRLARTDRRDLLARMGRNKTVQENVA